MKPKIQLVEPPSRREINQQLAQTAVKLHRMRQLYAPGEQAKRAQERLEWADETRNTQMARLLAGSKPRKWWQIWK